MSIPASEVERRSAAGALADIRSLQQRVATASRALLRRHGWRPTCLNPAHLWLWSKKLPDGRTLLTDLNTALAIECAVARQAPVAAAPELANPPPTAPINPGQVIPGGHAF